MRRLVTIAVVITTVLGFSFGADAQVYIAYREAGIVNKYDADTGTLVAERFIHGLTEPRAICLDHGVLYVLQQGGVVGKYDAESGNAINDHFISGFNMPQAMAVSDGVVYVASFSWPFQHLGQADSLIGKFNANTGATLNASLLKTDQLAIALAVSGHNLFVASGGGSNPNGPAVFDTETGAPFKRNYQPLLGNAAGIAADSDWVWFTTGPGTYGSILKYSANSSATAVDGGVAGYFRPLVRQVNAPTAVTVSGDDLFVGNGHGTAVAKYNATTGDLIKADFIPNRGDSFAGITAVPRAASSQLSLGNAEFAANNALMSTFTWASMNGTTLCCVAAILVLLVVLGLALVWHYRVPEPAPELATGPSPETTATETTTVTPEPATDPDAQAEIAPVQPSTPPASIEPSFAGMMLLGLFAFALLFAGALFWFASQSIGMMPAREAGLIGAWGIDPNDASQAGGPPVYCQVSVYPDHLEYSGGHGTTKLDGQWRNDGFWYTKPDGSGEVEVCHLKDPLNLAIHLATFPSGEQGEDVLYKERGSDEEMKEIKDRYPGPITYPPPADVFKFWMSEFELNNLPWRADQIESWGSDPAYSRGKIYDYHSDNPQVPQLQVTVKNHRVIKVSSGTSDPLDHIHP